MARIYHCVLRMVSTRTGRVPNTYQTATAEARGFLGPLAVVSPRRLETDYASAAPRIGQKGLRLYALLHDGPPVHLAQPPRAAGRAARSSAFPKRTPQRSDRLGLLSHRTPLSVGSATSLKRQLSGWAMSGFGHALDGYAMTCRHPSVCYTSAASTTHARGLRREVLLARAVAIGG